MSDQPEPKEEAPKIPFSERKKQLEAKIRDAIWDITTAEIRSKDGHDFDNVMVVVNSKTISIFWS